jgi:hypothetical protein
VVDQRAQMRRLRDRGRNLHAEFFSVEDAYWAGALSTQEEVVLLIGIMGQMRDVILQMRALVPRRSNPAPPISN